MKILKSFLSLQSDEILMGLIQKGNSAALSEIYERYSKPLLFFLYKLIGNYQEKSQDFLHDIFLKIIEKPDLFDRSKKFKTWIYQVAYNKCKNEYRNQKTRNDLKNQIEIREKQVIKKYNPDDEIDSQWILNFINRELSKYSVEHASTFLLRYQNEMSIKEIAEICECPEGTVKSRLFYVTEKLSNKTKKYFNDYSEENI